MHAGLDVGNKSTCMSHKRLCKSLVSVKIHWPSLLNILMSVSVKVDIHNESHIFPIGNILADVMLLKTLVIVASFGRDVMSSWALSDEIISALLGHIALSLGSFCV